MLSSPGVVGLDLFCQFIETRFRSRLPAPLLHSPGVALAAHSQDMEQPLALPRPHYPTWQYQFGPQLPWQPCHFPRKASPNLLLINSNISLLSNKKFLLQRRMTPSAMRKERCRKWWFGARVGSMAHQPLTSLQSREETWPWLLITQRNRSKLWSFGGRTGLFFCRLCCSIMIDNAEST